LHADRIGFFFRNVSQIAEKMPYLASLKNPSKIPRCRSKRGWLPQFNHFFFVQRHESVKNFREYPSSSFYLKSPTNRQTDRQTDTNKRRWNITSLSEVMKSFAVFTHFSRHPLPRRYKIFIAMQPF